MLHKLLLVQLEVVIHLLFPSFFYVIDYVKIFLSLCTYKSYVGVYAVLRIKLVKQGSGVYTVTIPKAVIEANRWENSEFDLEVKNGNIILRRIKK